MSVEPHQGTNIIKLRIKSEGGEPTGLPQQPLLPKCNRISGEIFVVFCQKSSRTGFGDNDGGDVDVNETGGMHSVVRSTSASGPCMQLQQQEARGHPTSLLLLLLQRLLFFFFWFVLFG